MTEHYYNNNIDLNRFAAMLTAFATLMLIYHSVFGTMA